MVAKRTVKGLWSVTCGVPHCNVSHFNRSDALLRLKLLKKNNLIVYFTGSNCIEKSERLTKEFAKLSLTELRGEDNACMLTAGKVPLPRYWNEILCVITQERLLRTPVVLRRNVPDCRLQPCFVPCIHAGEAREQAEN